MLRVGLTGGTACGKSTVAEMFAARPRVFWLDADRLVRDMYSPQSEVTRRVAQAFGAQVLDASGAVDRRRLADLVFADAEKLKVLEAIVHPAVIAAEHKWMDQIEAEHPEAIALVEATKMLEAGSHKNYDHVVLVTCQPEVQAQRFLSRHSEMSEAEARAEIARRSQAQFSDQRRRSMVDPDFIVDNSGSREQTEAQVDAIYRGLLAQQSLTQKRS
jgi:dephospho-CoA kinase